jgi:GDP-mannose 6-dehydrogenase
MKNVLAVCCRLVNLSQEGKEVPPIVIRSTLPPGAYDTTLAPFCPPEGSLRMTYNPEFGREGNAIADFMKPERIVIGVRGRRDALKVQRLYKAVKAPVHVTSWNNAEILKCAENAFHALKVSFANEVGSICESFGAEGDEVMALLCADTRLNISPAYLRPGLPFGGPCLSKDLNALATGALQRSISVPLLRAIPQSNRQHFERIVQAIRKKRSRVEFLGLSHKAGVNDRRGSHLLALAKRLQKEGIEVRTPASQLQQDELSHDQKCSPTRSSERRDRRSDADIVFAPGAVGSVKD